MRVGIIMEKNWAFSLAQSMLHANALISDASRWFVDSIFLQQSFLLDLGNRSETPAADHQIVSIIFF